MGETQQIFMACDFSRFLMMNQSNPATVLITVFTEGNIAKLKGKFKSGRNEGYGSLNKLGLGWCQP